MTNVTFPQLIQRGCGIDVHLKVVVATIDGVGIRKETRTFDTFTSCLTEMKEWLLANGITHVAMESTGVYWKPVMRVLEDCNIKLSSVVANTSGVTATVLIDMLCEGRKLTIEDIESVYHKKLSASPQELLEACTGFVEEHHVYMLQMIRKSIAQTQGLVDELSKRIKEILIKYDNVLELLKEIPGFNTKVVEDLVSEIGLDMSAFPSEKHLASWAGICPGNNESAGKKKRALIAVAHSLLTAAYLILSTGARYHELGAQYMQAKIEKKRKVYLTAELKKLGYKVSLEKNMEATES